MTQGGLLDNKSTISSGEVNGIPILCETVPFFKTISFSVFITYGARDEQEDMAGMLHFIEHLVFKGTDNRSQRDIAMEIDALGGHIEAFTTKETTCFNGRVVKERLDEAFDITADMILNSTFPEDEVERERQVILEEIRMAEDNPSDFIQDRMYSAIFGDHPLGRLITGDNKTVTNMSRDDLENARQKLYRPPNIVVTACGAIGLTHLSALVERYFGSLDTGEERIEEKNPGFCASLVTIEKTLEQTHLIAAYPGISMSHPMRHDLTILDTITGGGVSSRIFQAIREERGLAYSISSFYEQYRETGFFAVYAACSPEKLSGMWAAIKKEIDTIIKTPPTKEEVERAKAMEKDNIIMSFESPSSRAYQMADEMIYFGKVFTMEESLDQIDAVTQESIHRLAKEIFENKNPAIITLGPEPDRYRADLS